MISRDPDPDDGSSAAATQGLRALPPEAHEVLRETFGFDDFREGQAEVVAAVLERRDVLCVMPTGAGKSLCYQLPALLLDGLTLVVSPLISLMQDQIQSLQKRGVAAAAINSTVPTDEQDEIIDDALRGELRLLFVAPERFRNERFRRRMEGLPIALVAVDEAHCISQWGHDFRPDYRRLAPALEVLGRPPVLALTATAPPEVQEDVVAQLALRDPIRLLQGLVRSNLAYDVITCRGRDAKDRKLVELLPGQGGTLIYAATRRSVERIYETCAARGLPVLRYHAGLPDEERMESQRAFLSGEAPLMVATNAFGMGVDRPDIRHVIHYEIPRTVEAYVQETGRAGRDGEPARCTLLFSAGDLHIQRFFMESSNPSREVVVEVFRVLQAQGERRLELTADQIATAMRIDAPGQAVGAALAILDRASVVRRGRRSENKARVTVLPPPGDLFALTPLPPGLSRLLAHLVERFHVDTPSSLDIPALAEARSVTEETIRRGLHRLHDMGRIEYVPAFRGRATELRHEGLPEDVLESVDFEALEAKRAHEEKKLEEMIDYAHGHGCRVQYLLACFGVEGTPRCGRCDRCQERRSSGMDRAGRSGHAEQTLRTVLKAVKAYDKRYGFGKLAGHLAGSRAEGVVGGPLGRGPTYGALSHLGGKGAERWLRMAHESGLLRLVPHKLAGSRRRVHTIALSPLGLRVVKGAPLPSLDE